MKRLFTILILVPFMTVYAMGQKMFTLTSPDGKVKTEIKVGNTTVSYSVIHEGDVLISESPISMTIADGESFGINPRLIKATRNAINKMIPSPLYKKNQVADQCNELTLRFKGDYHIVFRTYDDGMAYRFVSTSRKPFNVENEQVLIHFPDNHKIYVPYVKRGKTLEEQFFNSFENKYEYISLSDWDTNRMAFAPLLVEGVNGKKICITEADLLDYPGMYFYNKDGDYSLEGVFARYPKEMEQGGHNRLQMLVKERESYIARCQGAVSFPWRVIVIAQNDYELADNDMVYRLATPNVIGDTDWIKPGKVAWDWWNDWNIYGVDFEAGINNETYKYYIDFAARYGIEYVILDEGWAVNLKADLFDVVPEIDLEELISYANKKNVGLILWAGYHAFNRDMERVCKHYSEMGIKGFKVDFMDRDDQMMVDFHRRGAKIAAKYKLMIDYHGTYKPTGLHRTYPNVINFEGVNGLEQLKWSAATLDQVTYDVTIPFIRMVAGPMDYTQGAMRNAIKSNYYPVNSEAMSQGTRCRQLAEYVVFESPLNMLCDSPSSYMREEECTEFIATIPTVWDETRALNGEVSKYISMARRKGDIWYIGSLTNWDSRSLNLDLSFLNAGPYQAEIYRDGKNAHRIGCDYVKETIDIPSDRKLKIDMAPGGGCALRIYKK